MPTLAQFNTASNATSSTQQVSISATLAGDFIVVAGCHVGTAVCNSITTNHGDTGVFQKVNGTTTPIIDTTTLGATVPYYVSLIAPTVGTTIVNANYNTTPSGNDLGVWVIRGYSTLALDKSIELNNGAVTISLSGLSGTLSASAEFVMAYNIGANPSASINTSQTGSSGFSQDAISGNANGFSHQITTTTTSVQSAWNQNSGAAIHIESTFTGTLAAPPGTITILTNVTDAIGTIVLSTTTATQSGGGGGGGGNLLAVRPFAATSPWNTLIPNGATYTNIAWPASTGYNYAVAWDGGTPSVYQSNTGDPVVAVNYAAGWGYPGGILNIPLASGITGADGSDAEIVIIQGDNVHQFWIFNRTSDTTATAQAYGVSSYSSGTGFGTSSPFLGAGTTAIGASEMGGLLVQDEVVADGAILHALQLAAEMALTRPGFVPPAIAGDGPTTGGIVQEGWLLGIPKTTAMPGGLSPLGQQVFTCFQNYGCYIVDVAGGVSNLRTQSNGWDVTTMTNLWHDMGSILPLSKRVT